MSPHDQHLEQARANLRFAEALLRAQPADPTAVQWVVTAIYYCALHCVDAHLASYGVICQTHKARREALSAPQHGVPQNVRTGYRILQDWSQQGRYGFRTFDPTVVEHSGLRLYLPRITGFVQL